MVAPPAVHSPHVTLSNIPSTTETSADICAVKHVTPALLDAVGDSASHVPILTATAPCVVWGNTVGLDPSGY